jgi:hypothetical protein
VDSELSFWMCLHPQQIGSTDLRIGGHASVDCITHLMKLFGRLVLSAVVLLPSFALAQDNPSVPPNQSGQTDQSAPQKQETPQPQTNPATQANLPNAPSSLITAKPHGQGKIPLEDVPHPQVTLVKTPLNIVGDTYRMFTSPIYIRGGDLKWMLPLAAATRCRAVSRHARCQGHRESRPWLQQLQ